MSDKNRFLLSSNWTQMELLRVVYMRLRERGIDIAPLPKEETPEQVLRIECVDHDKEAFEKASSLLAERVAASGMTRFFRLPDGVGDADRGISSRVTHDMIGHRLVLEVAGSW